MAAMRRREYTDPTALHAMQSLAARSFPATGFRHIGDLTWNWCLYLDRDEKCPTAIWTHGERTLAWGRLEPPDSLMLQVDPDGRTSRLTHHVPGADPRGCQPGASASVPRSASTCRNAARTLPEAAGRSGSRTAAVGMRPCACRTALMTVGLGSANIALDMAARR